MWGVRGGVEALERHSLTLVSMKHKIAKIRLYKGGVVGGYRKDSGVLI